MSDNWWDRGLRHFECGNCYAAKEYWEAGLEQAESNQERARFANALVPVYYRLFGPSRACEIGEVAKDYAEDPEVAVRLRLECNANLCQVLCEMDGAEEALRIGRAALDEVSAAYPLESVMLYEAYLYTLIQAELYREVLRLESSVLGFAGMLEVTQGRDYHRALFLHYLGSSAQALGEEEEAFGFYLQAALAHRCPETVMDLCRAFLMRGDIQRALQLADDLHGVLWNFPHLNEKLQLAYCLVVVGNMARFAQHDGLYRRCLERAELYFGQLSAWNEWVNIKDWRTRVQPAGQSPRIENAAWEQWEAFLDDLSLLDGLELMFPRVFRMSRCGTDMAVRLATSRIGEHHPKLRKMQVAGRMLYLGYTVMYPDEAQAIQGIQSRLDRDAALHHTERLLGIYPHTEDYCALLRRYRDPLNVGKKNNDVVQWMADCLNISMRYVECTSLSGMDHRAAAEDCLAWADKTLPDELVTAFRHFVVES